MSTDQFWAEYRAQEEAARGKHADPSACGCCRNLVADGEQVKHDGCAQRATLLLAPDAPSYEVLVEMTEDELAALPARFHTPVFDDCGKPNLWLCAVCWGDGWVTGWPCKTARKEGTKVFTPVHDAQREQEKQKAEHGRLLAETEQLRKRLADEERLHGDTIDDRDHFHEMADKLAYAIAPEEVIGEHSSMNCPWDNALELITPKAEVDKLRTELEQAKAVASDA